MAINSRKLIIMTARKITSIVTAACFIFSFIAAPAVQAALSPAMPAAAALPLPGVSALGIPSDAGRITAVRSLGGATPVIIIQDLHCHPEVQKNIVRILTRLERDHGIKNIYLEGAYGNVSTGWLAALNKTDLGKKVLDAELNRGWLDGAEYYSIVSGKTDIIKGLENKRVYDENIHRLNLMMDQRAAARSSLDAMKQECAVLQGRYFSRGNAALARLKQRNENGSLSSKAYYNRLIHLADKAFMDMSRYPDIVRFNALEKEEDRLSLPRAVRELQKVMATLRTVLPYQEYQHIVSMAGDNERRDDFMALVAETARLHHINIASDHPHLSGLIAFQSRQAMINPQSLIREERALVYELHGRFAASPAEREIVFLTEFTGLLENVLFNRVTAEDYAWYEAHAGEFNDLWPRYSRLSGPASVKSMITFPRDFYAANLERNKYFFDAILSGTNMTGTETKAVNVVVTGGFHTDGLARLLREKGISHIVITPAITRGTDGSTRLYEELIQSQNTVSAQTIAAQAQAQGPFEIVCQQPVADAIKILLAAGKTPEEAMNDSNNLLESLRLEYNKTPTRIKEVLPLRISKIIKKDDHNFSFWAWSGTGDNKHKYNVNSDGAVSLENEQDSAGASQVASVLDARIASWAEGSTLKKLAYNVYTVFLVNWESLLLLPVIGSLLSKVLAHYHIARSDPDAVNHASIISAAAAGLMLVPNPSIKLMCFVVVVMFSASQFYATHSVKDIGRKRAATLFIGSIIFSAAFWAPIAAYAGIPLPFIGMPSDLLKAIYTGFIYSFIAHSPFNLSMLVMKWKNFAISWIQLASIADSKQMGSRTNKRIDITLQSGKIVSFHVDQSFKLQEQALKSMIENVMVSCETDDEIIPHDITVAFLENSQYFSKKHNVKGYVRVNESILKIENEKLKNALLLVGIYHDLCRELTGKSGAVFEEEQMTRDVDYFLTTVFETEMSLDVLEANQDHLGLSRFAVAVNERLDEKWDDLDLFRHDFNNATTVFSGYAGLIVVPDNHGISSALILSKLAVKLGKTFDDRFLMIGGADVNAKISKDQINMVIHDDKIREISKEFAAFATDANIEVARQQMLIGVREGSLKEKYFKEEFVSHMTYACRVLQGVYPELAPLSETGTYEIDLNEELAWLVHVRKSKSKTPEILLELPENHVVIKTDKRQARGELCRAFANIIVNALEAMQTQSDIMKDSPGIEPHRNVLRVTLETSADGDFANVTVSDTGGGIPAEKNGKKFDPYEKDASTKDKTSGRRGLGLYQVKGAIENVLMGSISHKVGSYIPGSELKGTRFNIVLPLNVERGKTFQEIREVPAALEATGATPGALVKLLSKSSTEIFPQGEFAGKTVVIIPGAGDDYLSKVKEITEQGGRVFCLIPVAVDAFGSKGDNLSEHGALRAGKGEGGCFDVRVSQLPDNDRAWEVYYPEDPEGNKQNISDIIDALYSWDPVIVEELGITTFKPDMVIANPLVVPEELEQTWLPFNDGILIAGSDSPSKDSGKRILSGEELRVASTIEIMKARPSTSYSISMNEFKGQRDKFASQIADLSRNGINTIVLRDIDSIALHALPEMLMAARAKSMGCRLFFYSDIPVADLQLNYAGTERLLEKRFTYGLDGVRIDAFNSSPGEYDDILKQSVALRQGSSKSQEQIAFALIMPKEAKGEFYTAVDEAGICKVVPVYSSGVLPKMGRNTWLELRKKRADGDPDPEPTINKIVEMLNEDCVMVGFDIDALPSVGEYDPRKLFDVILTGAKERIALLESTKTPAELFEDGRKLAMNTDKKNFTVGEDALKIIISELANASTGKEVNVKKTVADLSGKVSDGINVTLGYYGKKISSAGSNSELNGFLFGILGRAMVQYDKENKNSPLEGPYKEIMIWALARGGITAGEFDGNIDNLRKALEGRTPPAPGTEGDVLLKECVAIRKSLDSNSNKVRSRKEEEKVADLISRLTKYCEKTPSSALELAELLWLLMTEAPREIIVHINVRQPVLPAAIHSLLSAA